MFETSDPSEAPIIRSILKGADIPFIARPGNRGDKLGFFRAESQFAPGAGLVRFWVPSARAEEARALLTEVEPTDDESLKGDG